MGMVEISLIWGNFHVLEEKMKRKGKRKRTRKGKEAKRRGMGIVVGSEMAGKGKGKHLDLGTWEEEGMGKTGEEEGKDWERRKVRGAEKEREKETRSETRKQRGVTGKMKKKGRG